MPVPQPGPGEMLLRTLWLSLDPYMRGRMSDAPSYATPVAIGQVMEGRTVSEVVASNNRRLCRGRHRAQPERLADPRRLRRQGRAQDRSGAGAGLDRARRARHAGHDRLHGPARHRPAAGGRDRGGVGRLRRGRLGGRPDRQDQGRARRRHRRRAGQVPLRGGGARLRRLHRPSRAAIWPGGSRRRARTASTSISRMSAARCSRRCFRCSTISRACRCAARSRTYNATEMPAGELRTSALTRAILTKRLTLRGFIVSDFAARHGDFLRDVSAWLREGRIKYREDVVDGLEKAPRALIGLLRGENFGKMLVASRRIAVMASPIVNGGPSRDYIDSSSRRYAIPEGFSHDDSDDPRAAVRAGAADLRADAGMHRVLRAPPRSAAARPGPNIALREPNWPPRATAGRQCVPATSSNCRCCSMC